MDEFISSGRLSLDGLYVRLRSVLAMSCKWVPKDVFANSFSGVAEAAEKFSYFQTHACLGSNSHDEIALANKIASR
jgi:hypothetical protein